MEEKIGFLIKKFNYAESLSVLLKKYHIESKIDDKMYSPSYVVIFDQKHLDTIKDIVADHHFDGKLVKVNTKKELIDYQCTMLVNLDSIVVQSDNNNYFEEIKKYFSTLQQYLNKTIIRRATKDGIEVLVNIKADELDTYADKCMEFNQDYPDLPFTDIAYFKIEKESHL